jgi:aspartate/methionine/tyrosine aminotransferase
MSPIRPLIRAMQPSGIGKIAMEGLGDPEVIPLWFGESDLITPEFIREPTKQALDSGKTFYSWARGHLPLREALLRYHARHYGLALDPDRVTVPGSTMLAVVVAAQCVIEAGDEVILVSPYWPNIRTTIEIQGGRPVDIRLREGPDRWWLDLDDVARAITPRTKAIYVNSPSNPTGWVMSAEEQHAMLALARRHGLAILADEVYHRNVFSGSDPAPSFLALAEPDEPVFVINGFSKGWAMTGWRLGWLVHPTSLAVPMAVLSEVANTGATAFVQYGGIAALDEGEGFLAQFMARCAQNRRYVQERLGAHPRVRLLAPEGAFYVFPELVGLDGLAFARRALREAKVGTAPGYTFGPGNEHHLRLCIALSPERFAVAIDRLVALLDRS